jgi:hypothetical protein
MGHAVWVLSFDVMRRGPEVAKGSSANPSGREFNPFYVYGLFLFFCYQLFYSENGDK